MKSVWLGNTKGEERENLRSEIVQAQKVLDKLQEIVYNMRNDRMKVSPPDYQCASWSHLQAHQNGFAEACTLIADLLKIDPPKQN